MDARSPQGELFDLILEDSYMYQGRDVSTGPLPLRRMRALSVLSTHSIQAAFYRLS